MFEQALAQIINNNHIWMTHQGVNNNLWLYYIPGLCAQRGLAMCVGELSGIRNMHKWEGSSLQTLKPLRLLVTLHRIYSINL